MSKIPIIFDTDPGTDDFFGFMISGAHDWFDVRAITPVAGNQTYEKVSANAIDIAGLFGIESRFGVGAEKPMQIKQVDASHAHGSNGLGGVELPKGTAKYEDKYAWDIMYEEVCKDPGNVHIIAVGPLTNVAIACLKYPDFAEKVASLGFMGGSTTVGNMSAYAEFNIFADPHAGEVVMRSGIKDMRMVGLNATHDCLMNYDEYMSFLSSESNVKEEVDQVMQFRCRLRDGTRDFKTTLHDAITIASYLDDDLIEYKKCKVNVETKSVNSIGQTVVSHRKNDIESDADAFNCNVAMRVNKEKFKEILKSAYEFYR